MRTIQSCEHQSAKKHSRCLGKFPASPTSASPSGASSLPGSSCSSTWPLSPVSLHFNSHLERQSPSRVPVLFLSVGLVSCLVFTFPETWEPILFVADMERGSCAWCD